MAGRNNILEVRLRSYSSAFSRHTFQDILLFDDFDHLDWLYHSEAKSTGHITYLDYLQQIYRSLSKGYRCEYVYKNEIIHHLLQQYRSKNSVIFNEFRVGPSVADLAFFNGESHAFEIKTEFDSDKRLCKQMQDYCRLFDKCYLVIPVEEYKHYVSILEDNIGIILLSYRYGHISLCMIREAHRNSTIDVDLLMSCCRTKEYESYIKRRFGALPEVDIHELYSSCCELMRSLTTSELKAFFLSSVKQRRQDLLPLRFLPRCLRQMCLSLNLSEKESALLINKLNCIIS